MRPLMVALAAGLLLSRLGPFDTFSDLRPLPRLAYWIGLTLLLALQSLAAFHLVRAWLGRRHWTLAAALAGLIGAIPSAFEVAWAEDLLRVQRDLGLVDLIAIYGDVVLIAVPLSLALAASTRVASAAQSLPEARQPPRWLAELPADRRGDLIAVAAEDHYLRVYTDRGESLILRRFGDALEELGAIDGLQVHRGWWVARAAVAGSEREGDRSLLILSNGLRVPVSRTNLRSVRNAGLLDG